MMRRGTVRVARKGHSGYPLPANADPLTDIVIAVHLPNDPAFLAAFWASIDFLQSPKAWGNDPAHTALIAARRMSEANNETRKTWRAIGDLNTLRINLDISPMPDAQQLPITFPEPTNTVQFSWDWSEWTSTST